MNTRSMKKALACLFLACFAGTASAQRPVTPGAQEPQAEFELLINGTPYQVKEGEELKLKTDLAKPTISIRQAALKKFSNGAVSFTYPRHYSFDFTDAMANMKHWTLTGNDIVVMLFQFDIEVSVGDIASGIAEKFGKRSSRVTGFKRELGGKMCEGKTVLVSLAEHSLSIDLYQLSRPGEPTVLIGFQSSLKENGVSTDEFMEGFSTIDGSITY